MRIGKMIKSIIYCKKIEDLERLVKTLQERNLNVASIVKMILTRRILTG